MIVDETGREPPAAVRQGHHPLAVVADAEGRKTAETGVFGNQVDAAAVFEPADGFQVGVIGAERHRIGPDVDRFGEGNGRPRDQDQDRQPEPKSRKKTEIKAPTHFRPF